jgi:hypothetical protein
MKWLCRLFGHRWRLVPRDADDALLPAGYWHRQCKRCGRRSVVRFTLHRGHAA